MWWVLVGMFISAVFVLGQLDKRRKSNAYTGETWLQQHVATVGVFAVVVPIAVGAILANTVCGDITEKRKVKNATRAVPVISQTDPPKKPQPVLKLVISDGSQATNVAVLNMCASDEVTLVQNGLVQCVRNQSPVIHAWIADVEIHEREIINKFISYQVNSKLYKKMQVKNSPKQPSVIQQGLWMGPAPAMQPAKTETVTKKKTFAHRYAELFYFFALVLGVLGKYFWDYYEDKRVGKNVSFHPHLIIMSFIIAALVYYSIQQGIEKEANKLTARGIVFAFNNGFMWQTVLTSLNSSKSDQPIAAEEKPAA